MNDRDNRRDEGMVERLAKVTAAYGADPARWPAGERAALKDILADMDAAAEQLDEERALDRLLDMVPPPEPPPGAVDRVFAAAGIRTPGGDVVPFRRAGPLAPVGLRFGPAIGLIAASLVLGIFTGTTRLVDPLFPEDRSDRLIEADELDTALVDLGFDSDLDDDEDGL
jgi:hypothetical protein